MLRRPPDRVTPGEARSSFAEEHRKLMALAAELGDATDTEAAAAALKALDQVLPAHLDDEERVDGLFEWLTALAPERGDAIDGLRSDHDDLRARLAAVQEGLGAGSSGALDRARGLVEALRAHEAREAELVRAALSA